MGEVALMSPSLPSGITDSINIFTLEKIWLGKHSARLSKFFHLSSPLWSKVVTVFAEIQRNCQGFHRKKPVNVHLLRQRLPLNSLEPSLISLMFKLADNTYHILFILPNHPPISKSFTCTSHSLTDSMPFLKIPPGYKS